jgi:hypothetical protein
MNSTNITVDLVTDHRDGHWAESARKIMAAQQASTAMAEDRLDVRMMDMEDLSTVPNPPSFRC